MEIEFVRLEPPRQTLEEFADEHNLTLVVKEAGRSENNKMLFHVYFKNTEILGRGNIIGEAEGRVDHAIRDFAKKISLHTIRYQGESIKVPRLTIWRKPKSKK